MSHSSWGVSSAQLIPNPHACLHPIQDTPSHTAGFPHYPYRTAYVSLPILGHAYVSEDLLEGVLADTMELQQESRIAALFTLALKAGSHIGSYPWPQP